MSGRVRLVAAIVVAVTVALGGVPIAAQQPSPLSNPLQKTRAGLFSTIQGTAINWTNVALANAPIRLRDARLGRVVNSVTTDRFGAFEFRRLEPGSYVVELMSPSDEVLAATPIIDVGSGDTVAALVKLPYRSPLGGALGRTLPTALAITAAAVAAGVLATNVAGAPASDRALPGQR